MQRLLRILAFAAVATLSVSTLAACQVKDAEPDFAEGVASVQVVEQSAWEWSPDTDCSPCHATEAETTASSLCATSQEEGNSCLLCHSDTATLSQAHAMPFDIRGTAKLRSTEVDSDSCSQCHNADDLTASNAGRTMLVDSYSTIVDPHALPDNKYHAALACSTCHKPHSDIPTEDTTRAACLSCHHQNVFECGTCH